MNGTTVISPTPDKTAVDQQHPWLGLASFTEETRQYFYGREEEVGELSRRVQRKLLTVLFGQSGLGKTSILNAGIVPRLRPEGFCPVYVRVDYSAAAVPPTEQIKQAIFRATASQGTWTKSGSANEGESLWEFLHHRDDELLDAAGKPIIPLLIFDQFEEIFTLAQADDAGRKRAAQFIEDLADLVENRPPKALEAKIDADDSVAEQFDFGRADYRILISLREDYLAHLEGVKSAMPSITQNRMRLARMNGEQALAAVTKPGGKLVTQEVAESIVRFVAGGAELRNAEVEPSLLSLICRELNNARIAQAKAEISVDLLAGSNETILAEFYERALADQPAAVRKVIEDDLLTDSGYRENLAEERVLKAFTAANAKPDAATTLATLVNRRLLRIEERLDVRRVELTHDVLCGVVKASREERLEREALAEAEKNLAAQKERANATRKALVRARQIATGCAVLSVVAVGSAIYGYMSATRAKGAEAEAVLSAERAKGAEAVAVLNAERAKGAEAVAVLNAERARGAEAEAVLSAARANAAQGEAVLSAQRAKGAEAVAVKTRLVSEASRGEAEKLVEFLLDDFLKEMQPTGRIDVVQSLATRAVDYYEKLPPEARSNVTQRNSADAKLIYASVLRDTGKLAEAKKLADEAGATIKALRAAGDNSDETVIAQVRHLQLVARLLQSRNDWPATIPLANEALELIKPVLAKADPLRQAREAQTGAYAVLADGYERTGRRAEQLEAAQNAQRISKQMGALELTDPSATMRYLWACRAAGSAFIRLSRLPEARAELESCLALSTKLLALRPGHRQALNNRAFLLTTLNQIETQQLNMARQLPYLREAVKIQQEIVALRGSSAEGQGALRFAHRQLADALIMLGRDDEALDHWRQAVLVGKDERLTGGAADSLAYTHLDYAEQWAERGDMKQSQADMAKAEQYFAVSKAAGAGQRAQLSARLSLNRTRANIALDVGGDLISAQRSIEQSIADFKAFFKDDKSAPLGGIESLHHLAARLLLAQGRYAEAETQVRAALTYNKPAAEPTLTEQFFTHELGVTLALALARQGKHEEANQLLVPVRAYYRLPQVMNSDDETLKGYHARVLLADALANPSQRATLLAAAMERINAALPTIKRLKWVDRIRDEIEGELKK